MISQGRVLRQLLAAGDTLMVPGAFNGLVGRICRDKGFPALYVSGAALSASQGLPDNGITPLTKFTDCIRELQLVSQLPILADADTGFGDVRQTTYEYIRAGAAGFHVEDQVFPKRCGHLEGKTLVPTQRFVEVLQQIKDIRDQTDPDFLICARTDARGVEGFQAAVERAKHYCAAGADMIFPEGLHDLEEFREFAQEVRSTYPRIYMLANMTEFGKTPHINVPAFQKAGYNLVIYPVSTLRAAMKNVSQALDSLKCQGSMRLAEEDMMTRKELYETLKYSPSEEWVFPGQS